MYIWQHFGDGFNSNPPCLVASLGSLGLSFNLPGSFLAWIEAVRTPLQSCWDVLSNFFLPTLCLIFQESGWTWTYSLFLLTWFADLKGQRSVSSDPQDWIILEIVPMFSPAPISQLFLLKQSFDPKCPSSSSFLGITQSTGGQWGTCSSSTLRQDALSHETRTVSTSFLRQCPDSCHQWIWVGIQVEANSLSWPDSPRGRKFVAHRFECKELDPKTIPQIFLPSFLHEHREIKCYSRD